MEQIHFRHGEWRLRLPCAIGATIYRVGCTRINGIPLHPYGQIFECRFNLSHLDPYTGHLLPHYFLDYDEALEYQRHLPMEREQKLMEMRGKKIEERKNP